MEKNLRRFVLSFIFSILFRFGLVFNAGNAQSPFSIQTLDPSFSDLIDTNQNVTILASSTFAFAHEAPVWIPATNELFFASNRLNADLQSPTAGQPQHIVISKLNLATGVVVQVVPIPDILMTNGAVRISDTDILICSQGSGNISGAIVRLNTRTLASQTITNTNFNSPNDIISSKAFANGLFFTDPPYGFAQEFRPAPVFPPTVWFYNPNTYQLTPLIQTITKPNGVAMSLDNTILYVTDTGFFDGFGNTVPSVPRATYAFDVKLGADGLPVTSGQRIFANASVGAPDGIKLDEKGNVYTGEGDGATVYSPTGKVLGKILVPNGVANLAFVGNMLVMMAEQNVLAVKLKVSGALNAAP